MEQGRIGSGTVLYGHMWWASKLVLTTLARVLPDREWTQWGIGVQCAGGGGEQRNPTAEAALSGIQGHQGGWVAVGSAISGRPPARPAR